MRKHGIEAFRFEIIACARTWAELCLLETILIVQYNSFGRPGGYNVTLGGEGTPGWIPSAEWRAKMSACHRKFDTPETCALRSIALRGKVRTPEMLLRIGAATKLRFERAEERLKSSEGSKRGWAKRKANGSVHTGRRTLPPKTDKRLSEATKAKLSVAMKRYWADKHSSA
jgi:hypothetical protein